LEAGLPGDDERLVERPLDERAARQPRGRVRIEVLGERGIAGSRHDEAAMCCRACANPVDCRGTPRGEDGRDDRTARGQRDCRESTGGAGAASHRLSFLARPAGEALQIRWWPKTFPEPFTTIFAAKSSLSSDRNPRKLRSFPKCSGTCFNAVPWPRSPGARPFVRSPTRRASRSPPSPAS